jgi:hypothetical protein
MVSDEPAHRPRELQYVSGPQPLSEAAIEAAIWWQYRVTAEAEEIDTMIEVAFPPLGIEVSRRSFVKPSPPQAHLSTRSSDQYDKTMGTQ